MSNEQQTIKVEIPLIINFKQTLHGWDAWNSTLGSTHANTKEECVRILKSRALHHLK